MRRIIAALALLALGASPVHAAVMFVPIFIPAPTVPAATKADYQRIRTVAIISAIGTSFHVEKGHFGGALTRDLNIDTWQLDDAVMSLLKGYLTPRFEIRDAPHDRQALAAISNGRLDNSSKALSNYLRAIPSDGIDAFVVIRPDVDRGYPPGAIEGVGIYIQGDDAPTLWTDYEIDIVDAKTLTQIAKASSRVRLRDNTPESFPGIVTSTSLNPGADLSFTDAQMKGLEATTHFLLRKSLIETVRALDLGVSLPATSARVLKPIPPQSDPYRAVKSVAIVSDLGDQLQEDNFNIFLSASTDHTTLPIGDWNLDGLAETRIKNLLSKRFEIVDAGVDRQALRRVALIAGDGKLRGDIPVLKADSADLYVLVLGIPLSVANIASRPGPGLYKFSTIHSSASVYANYLVLLVDGHTRKIRSFALAKTSPDWSSSRPWKLEDVSLWPDKPPTLSAAQEAQVKGDLTDMLNNSLDETLLSLGITGQAEDVSSLPPPEAVASPSNPAN